MHPLGVKKFQPLFKMRLQRPYASVICEVKTPIVTVLAGSIGIAKTDTEFAKLPNEFTVVDSDGNEIQPSGTFYINTETISPYHLIIDFIHM